MKLITEQLDDVEVIVENRNGKKSMFIEGIFLQGDIQNRNGRMYPMQTLRKEVRDTMKVLWILVVQLENSVILRDQQ